MARSATLDMTQGSLGRQIIGFSLPLMFTNLLQMLFSMVDLAVVGRFSSSAAMGSVGSTTTLIFLFTGFLMGLGSGVNVLVATHFGARSEKNVRESVHTSFLVCLIAGFLMLALGLIFARPLLELLNTRDDLIDGAELYLRIYFLGMPAAALYNYGNGVLNAIGDTKTPLIFLSTAGVLNVILDLVFVIGLGMSTDGVALASMLSQCVSAGLIVRSLMRSKEIYSLSLKEVRFHKDKAIHALSVGVPAGLQNAIFSVANLFIQAGVNSFSTVVVEGNSAAGNVDNLVYSVMNAFYIACSSFVGQNYGAGKSRRVLKSYLLTLCYSAVAAAVLGGLFLLFGHQFLSLFTSESDVIEAGLARIWVMCFSFPISATMDCTTAASRGLGKGLVPMIFVFLGSWRGSTPCSPTSIRSARSICSIRSRGYSRARRRSHTFCIAIRNMSSRWMRPTQRNEKELSERTALFLRPHWARVLFRACAKKPKIFTAFAKLPTCGFCNPRPPSPRGAR